MKYITTIGSHEYLVEIMDEHHVSVDGRVFEVDFNSISDQPVYSLLVNGESYEAYVYSAEDEWQVLLVGRLFNARVEDEREKRLRLQAGGNVAERDEYILKAPMPGLVVSVPVQEDQLVDKGDILVILESMKMQNELRSPRPGKVSRLRVKPGDSVEKQQTMMSVV
jgi:biotin carboxyl carrier protein